MRSKTIPRKEKIFIVFLALIGLSMAVTGLMSLNPKLLNDGDVLTAERLGKISDCTIETRTYQHTALILENGTRFENGSWHSYTKQLGIKKVQDTEKICRYSDSLTASGDKFFQNKVVAQK